MVNFKKTHPLKKMMQYKNKEEMQVNYYSYGNFGQYKTD